MTSAADRAPPGAAIAEAESSNLASADHKRDGRAPFGVKAKLFLAFASLAMLTCGASVVAWYAFADIDRSVTRITTESIVGMAASLRLAEKSAEIAATVPALIASRNERERAQEQQKLVERLSDLSAAIHGLKSGVAEAKLANVIEIEGKIATELKALDSAVEQRLRLGAQRGTAVANLVALHAEFQGALEPLVDDAGFDLVTASEDLAAKSKEAIAGLIESGVDALRALLTLRADGNLAAGLLTQAAIVDDPALIEPFRERFSAAAEAIERSLGGLRESPENGRLREASEALIALGSGADNIFEARSQELRAVGEARRSLEAKRERMAAAAESAHRALLEKLAPMVDDAGFDLVAASESVTAKSTEAITGLVAGGVRTLQVLLTLRADGNLAAGLLNEAAGVPDPSSLQPLQERFAAAAGHAKKLLEQLSAPAAEGPLKGLTETLIGFGASTGNLFDLRREELRQIAAAQASLEASSSLLLQLGNEVTDLVTTAQSNSDTAALRTAKAIHNGQLLLLLITAVSLIGSGLIVWLYVDRSLVARLKVLSSSMLAVAGGNLRVPLPEPRGGDEIAEMTRALVVFRNTAVEIETNNLREIALARQRLVEAIESISEGFALYDAEDLLVLSNRRYREVASPADPEAIVPGLTFESVIQRVAALGAVDMAGHRNEDWVAQRMAAHLRRDGLSMLYEHHDRWLQVSERPAGNGGLVVVWTDVTALKQGEILLREAFDRINQELAAARQLQLSMVPRHFPAWSEAQPIEIQAVMEPAREVGGDLYDFFLAAPGKFCFVVGDVSGKGTAAALFMARTRSLVRATVALWHQTAGAVPAPSAIMQAVNRELCLDNSERMFVTVFLATLDLTTGEVAYANAGHPAPYLMSPASPPIAIPAPPDLPLGIRSGAKFRDRSMALREQEALCLVTDGVLDVLNPSEEFFGKDRLTDALARLDGDPPSAIISGVLKAIDDFADGTPRFDDVTLLALRWSRSAPSRAGRR